MKKTKKLIIFPVSTRDIISHNVTISYLKLFHSFIFTLRQMLASIPLLANHLSNQKHNATHIFLVKKLCVTAFTSDADVLRWWSAHWVLEQSFHRDTLPTNVNYSNSVPMAKTNTVIFQPAVVSSCLSACRHSSGLGETGSVVCSVSSSTPTAEQSGAQEQKTGGVP